MLYERPGANVGTYKQTDRAVTSHTPILDPPNGHRGNQSPLSSPPPPIPNDQYISILRQENNNHSRELISSFLKPYNITVHFISMPDFCCKILYPESSKSSLYIEFLQTLCMKQYIPAQFHFLSFLSKELNKANFFLITFKITTTIYL